MILVADAGSTKTDWVLLREGSQIFMEFKTSGINPAQQSEQQISSVIAELKKQTPNLQDIRRIFYYGAGCLSDETNKKIENQLLILFPDSTIDINSDLLGACRALFANKSGIVGILGTGSNSCFFKNGKIEDQIPSLGFILGDEGSGSALGKRLLSAVFKKDLPNHIIDDFLSCYKINLPEVIENVYRSGRSAYYLASFAPYIHKNLQENSLRKLAIEEFENYFTKNLMKYGHKSSPIGIVGSIGFEFQSILQEVAQKYCMKISKFLRSPLEGLITYHKNDY